MFVIIENDEPLELVPHVARKLGCLNLSDIRSEGYRVPLQNLLINEDLSKYSLRNWSDFTNYVTGMNYEILSPDEAIDILLNYLDN